MGDWKKKTTLTHTIGLLLSNEPTIKELLTNELEIERPTLLELTLTNMKNETIRHAKLTIIKTDYTENTLKDELQELISQEISEENMEAIKDKQDELGTFEEQKLFDILSKKRNYQLLEDEKPTKRFLSLESRKAGYSEITRLRVKKPHYNPNLPINLANRDYFNVTESSQINTELHSTFKEIYKLQPN